MVHDYEPKPHCPHCLPQNSYNKKADYNKKVPDINFEWQFGNNIILSFVQRENRRIWRKSLYCGTPPYDHPVYKTTSLLRPYSFKPKVKNIDSFYYFEDPVNVTTSLLRPGFYGPTVVVLTGFHCNMNVRTYQKHNSHLNVWEPADWPNHVLKY